MFLIFLTLIVSKVFYLIISSIAVINNQLSALNLLINANANLNIKDTIGGRTPLMWGECILKLLENK